MEAVRKARKDHKCEVCHGTIHKGQKYIHYKHRFPVEDDDEVQTGIIYQSHRQHLSGCNFRLIDYWEGSASKEYAINIMKGCNFGKHEWDPEQDYDNYGLLTGRMFCKYCGELKT